ncbi:multiple coagulation factor deficiency protein 2 homolog isoform X1 [Mya arenaria]|uniref:multiple coagulation factor deficiency protein 2 homolog isoform X1 n=1 Tax=Mya arenaria TaxID=6604 RepID=UPI0022DF56E7|nr:multiple coagulation factor deficiency protein 2 homolog isoform X1 [Mya arenaria]
MSARETTAVVVVMGLLVGYISCQGAHPPGIPPPVQNMQQGQPQHGQHQQQQHGGHGGHGQPQQFGVNSHEAEHIKEHLKDVVEKPKEEMSDEELEFHYFKLHDYDGNNKLDGVEITKAITHFHEAKSKTAEEGDEEKVANSKVFSDEEIANIVDMVLKEDDLNNDGYIEYVEFVTAQRKARGGS